MDVKEISTEILDIRNRLTEIDDDRGRLLKGEYGRKAALQAEEYELRTRLAELQDRLASEERSVDRPSKREKDLRRTPQILQL